MKLAAVLFGAALTIAGSIAMAGTANAAQFTVEALSDSISSPLNTGLILNPAQTYDFAVADPANLWSAGSNVPYSRESTANGIDPVASPYGQWSENGFTANYGALVGFTMDNGYFLIGTGPTDLTDLTGDLQLMYWDSDYGDNSGQQVLNVSSVSNVPEPVTLSLFGAGLIGAAAMRRRRKVGNAA